MNNPVKQTVIIALAAGLFLATGVSAQTTAHSDAAVDINTGGGLGSGLNYMVRNILGEDNDRALQDVSRIAPVAPEASLMMDAQSDASATLMAPAPAEQSLKASLRSASALAADLAVPAPMTAEELHAYISGLLESDSYVQSVDTAETHVRVTYAVPAKIFRFVPVVLRVTAAAYASGETDVTFPWYAFATSRASSEFKRSFAERVEPMIPSGNFSFDIQKMLIDEMHASLAAHFGASARTEK